MALIRYRQATSSLLLLPNQALLAEQGDSVIALHAQAIKRYINAAAVCSAEFSRRSGPSAASRVTLRAELRLPEAAFKRWFPIRSLLVQLLRTSKYKTDVSFLPKGAGNMYGVLRFFVARSSYYN